MKRLTKRLNNGKELCIEVCGEKCVDGYTWCPKCKPFSDVMKKLAEYEDLEEQEKLIILPCKVGEDVWCLEEYEDGFDCSGYIFLAMCGEYCITSAHYMHLENLEEQLEEMVDDCENWGHTELNIIHKSRVFFTREEAEQALAKMKEV